MRFQVQPRAPGSAMRIAGITVGAMSFAFLAGAAVLYLAGSDPIRAYSVMAADVLGTAYGFFEALVKATPILFCGLSVMLAVRMGFWNIGAEGQLAVGAIAAAAVAGSELPLAPAWLRLPAMVAAAFAAGAAWALIAVALKLWRGVNEILSTLMLNYVAIALVGYLVYGPWRDPASGNFPLGPTIPASAQLLRLGDFRVNAGLALALVALVFVYLVLRSTRFGFAMRVIGDNSEAARTMGIDVGKSLALGMVLSGGLAGLAGFVEVAGIQHRLIPEVSSGYGYTGIIAALLGQLHPLGVLLSALFLGGLLAGGEVLQITQQLPVAVVFLFHGLVLILLLLGEFLARYRLVVSRLAARAPAGEAKWTGPH